MRSLRVYPYISDILPQYTQKIPSLLKLLLYRSPEVRLYKEKRGKRTLLVSVLIQYTQKEPPSLKLPFYRSPEVRSYKERRQSMLITLLLQYIQKEPSPF